MAKKRTQYAGTTKRRREIIKAALACFSELGFAKTTMADIRLRAKASHGSLYHHFGSKEQLAAHIYLEGIMDYQSTLLENLKDISDARSGIYALVHSHLDWVNKNPNWARYLTKMRHAEFMEATKNAMSELNKTWGQGLGQWFAKHIQAGKIRPLPKVLYIAFTLGPCQEYTRLWLEGTADSDPESVADEIAKTAWEALAAEYPPE